MCSTCNHTNYQLNEKTGRLEQGLGLGGLLITCDTKGKNYKIEIRDNPKSAFVVNKCITCGKKLF